MDTRIYIFVIIFSAGSFAALQPGNWNTCEHGVAIDTRTDTSLQVNKLRDRMKKLNLAAYIVPSEDFHLNEIVSGYDQRRKYISGFDGAIGIAVITANRTALWTTSKYFTLAEKQLGCTWILMREKESDVPKITAWLKNELANQKIKTVGACPYFIGNAEWLSYNKTLIGDGLRMANVTPDLIDQIWTAGRPSFPDTVINEYPVKYAGKSWQQKILDVQKEMVKKSVEVLVVSMLDENAWLFNMRASDISGFVKDPFFYSLAIVYRSSVSLYITNKHTKLSTSPSDDASNLNVMSHLRTKADGTCEYDGNHPCIKVKEYDYVSFVWELFKAANSTSVKKVWVSYFSNYAIYKAIPLKKIYIANTPVAMFKTQKNSVEVKGMVKANIRDAAALARFAAKLEKELKAGNEWTEVSAAAELTRFRSLQKLNRGNSFTPISSVGSNAAILRYTPTKDTNLRITTNEVYLIDSGGQYLDGTTDITRTFLWGEPTKYFKECYTRVLMGQLNLAMAVWTKGLYGREIDAWARQPLFKVGLTYKHGTGHGVGHYLGAQEGPGRISTFHKTFKWDVPLNENMFYSNEPGYYEDGEFGVRLGNIVYVKAVTKKYEMKGVTMLGMETVTLFPYETNLIDYCLLSDTMIEWLNDYNEKTRDKVGTLLKKQKDNDALTWLEKRTKKIKFDRNVYCKSSASSTIAIPSMILSLILIQSFA